MKKISKSYAQAFFQKMLNEIQIGKDSENLKILLNERLEELALLSATIGSSRKLSNFFQNPFIPERTKFEVLLSLFSKLSKESESLLRILLFKREIYLLPEIFSEYWSLLNKFIKLKKIKITTASYLDKNLGKKFLNKIKKIISAEEFILEIEYKKEIIGGLILEFDSLALDASIIREFKALLNETC